MSRLNCVWERVVLFDPGFVVQSVVSFQVWQVSEEERTGLLYLYSCIHVCCYACFLSGVVTKLAETDLRTDLNRKYGMILPRF